jgi:hypothetical protein
MLLEIEVAFTPAELKDLTTLCELGAKIMSQDKPLQESAHIQNTALTLIRKLNQINDKPPEIPEVEKHGSADDSV